MDTNASFLLRWRGRQQGPFTLAQIERKLAENEIGMLHEIQVGAEWVTLKSWIEKIDAERRTLAEQVGAPITQPTSRTTLHLADTGGRKRSATTGGAGTGLVRMPPDYELRIGDLVPRAWHAITSHFAITILTAFLFLMISSFPIGFIWAIKAFIVPLLMAVHPVVYIISWVFITILTLLVNAVVYGPFFGGLAYTYIGLARGEARSITDLFVGFRRKFGHTLLGWFVPQFIIGLAMLVGVIPFLIIAIMAGVSISVFEDPQAATKTLGISWIVLAIAYLLVVYLPMLLLLSARWFYVVPLVVDRQIGFWSAMVLSWRQVGKHQWGFISLWVVASIIDSLGLLFCGVGMFFSWPLYEMIMMAAYIVMYTVEEEA